MTKGIRNYWVLAIGLLALGMVAGVRVASAQEKSPAKNIAVIDMTFILQNSTAAKNLRAQVEKIRADFQREIIHKRDEMDKIDQSLVRERPKLSDRDFQQRLRKLRQAVANNESDMQERQSKLDGAFRGASQKVVAAIEQVVDQIIQERKLSVVLPLSSIIGTPAAPDITQEVQKRLNQRMPSVAVDIPK